MAQQADVEGSTDVSTFYVFPTTVLALHLHALPVGFWSRLATWRRAHYHRAEHELSNRPQAASVFRAISESEENHAMGHLEFLQDSGDPVANLPISNTVEMLQSAVVSENHDSSSMYPEFARGSYPLFSSPPRPRTGSEPGLVPTCA